MSRLYTLKSGESKQSSVSKNINHFNSNYFSSFETIEKILSSLNDKFCFTRFGDGELLMMGGWKGKASNHFASDRLVEELIESFQINDSNYLIGDSSQLINEKFVKLGLFGNFPNTDKLQKISKTFSKTDIAYNFITLHYLFVFFPKIFKTFIEALRVKSIGIVGSNIPENSRKFFGAKEFVEIPDFQAYETIDQWYSKIKKMKSDLILFCAGISSCPAQKRLWVETDKSSIDLGSIINGLNIAINPEYNSSITRTWIRMSLDELRKNYK